VLLEGEIPAAERRLLQWMIRGGEHISLIRSNLRTEHLTHPGVRELLETFGRAEGPSGTVDFHRHLAHLREPNDVNLVSRLALEESPDPTEEEVLRLLKQLEKKYLKREHGTVVEAIRRAEQAGEPEEVSRLMERAKEIGKRIVELGR
jgi:replicative DNA helicase